MTDNNRQTLIDNDYRHATGKLEFNMTNNYMFIAILQESEDALRGLIAALLHMDPHDIKKIEYLNPIIIGEMINLKEYILDVNVMFNDNTIMNFEMQVKKQVNWVERSISYLCREWDKINKGDDYIKAMNTFQISFLDHTLFDDRPKFYSTYRLCDIEDGYQYSSKFNLCVIQLNHIDQATDEDKHYGIDEWARLFKATTWEEIRMLAEKNEYIDSAAREMFVRGQDNKFIDLCRKTAEEIAGEEHRRQKLIEYEEIIARQTKDLADKDKAISDKDEEIARLMAELKAAKEN